MKKIFFFVITFALFLTSVYTIDAAKKPTPTKKPTVVKTTVKKSTTTAGKSSGTTKIRGTNVAVSYAVKSGSLGITFSNIKKVSFLTYTLMYMTNEQQEGAMGTVYPKGASTASRTLLFGTCSKNVCRYHTNVSNVKLQINGKLTSGKTFSSSYSIAY